jgi:uncharacterized membrane protein
VSRGRLEAFSDGVIAILITIMVLDLRPPAGSGFGDLHPLLPKLLVYVLSFTFLAIYWVNHHHLMQVVERINGGVLWANTILLFSLSLVPAGTAWLGEHPRATAPVFVYGVMLLLCAISYYVLCLALLRVHDPASRLAVALGRDWKGKGSLVAYVVALPVAFVAPLVSMGLYIAVAITWLVPDRRIERVTGQDVVAPPEAD